MKLTLNRDEYRDKVLACWLGKNIGGTAGMPFEWRRQVNHIEFYTQDLKGEPLPNDDLDIQLMWLLALEEKGPNLNTQTLADYWSLFLTPYWVEYGTAKINMRAGLQPPLCGTLNNLFKHSCGAYIRSEIWACVAPGLPEVAAAYAYEDAIIDHGNGEGTFGEIFFAALESAAFVLSDLRELIRIGLSYIPSDSAVARAIRLAEEFHDVGKPWEETRGELLQQFRGQPPSFTSPEDAARGFDQGVLGFDVPVNVALTILALLEGGDDFGKIICTAVNCGEDTDCTAATAGSIFGLLHGTKGIPQRWIDPIGRSIKTMVLSDGDIGWKLPKTVDELTARTEKAMDRVMSAQRNSPVGITNQPTDLQQLSPASLFRSPDFQVLNHGLNGPIFHFDFFSVSLDYGDAPLIGSGVPKEIRVRVQSRHRVQANLVLKWYVPSGWKVSPTECAPVFVFHGDAKTIPFTLSTDKVIDQMNRGVLEITAVGMPTVMLVPITLMNGDFMLQKEMQHGQAV